MDNNCNYLFVYGSLLNNSNEYGQYLKQHTIPLTQGSFGGFLYDLGEYPGAIFNSQTNNMVYGTILQLNSAVNTLKIIDEYEGFGPDEEQPNLFVRKMLGINTSTGIINCWVYLYNRSVTGRRLIPSGKYY